MMRKLSEVAASARPPQQVPPSNQVASAVDAVCEMLKHVATLLFVAFIAYGFYLLVSAIPAGK